MVWSCCSEIQCLCVYLTELERQRKALAQRILARLTLFVLVALKLGMCKIYFLISVPVLKKNSDFVRNEFATVQKTVNVIGDIHVDLYFTINMVVTIIKQQPQLKSKLN